MSLKVIAQIQLDGLLWVLPDWLQNSIAIDKIDDFSSKAKVRRKESLKYGASNVGEGIWHRDQHFGLDRWVTCDLRVALAVGLLGLA